MVLFLLHLKNKLKNTLLIQVREKAYLVLKFIRKRISRNNQSNSQMRKADRIFFRNDFLYASLSSSAVDVASSFYIITFLLSHDTQNPHHQMRRSRRCAENYFACLRTQKKIPFMPHHLDYLQGKYGLVMVQSCN